jgi:hypothetical protein
MKNPDIMASSSLDVIRQVVSHDLSFVPYRPNILTLQTKEDEFQNSLYLKTRVYLLSCKAQNKELILQVETFTLSTLKILTHTISLI